MSNKALYFQDLELFINIFYILTNVQPCFKLFNILGCKNYQFLRLAASRSLQMCLK
jgi:hypothetical protein